MIKISIYSGKCDVYDSCVMIYEYEDDTLRNNVKFYIGDERINISCKKDLIPYYPHTVVMSAHDGANKSAVIYMSEESYVDREEKETLQWYLEDILKIYNRCKRKKTEFDPIDAVNQVCWNHFNEDQITEIAHRVAKYGKKANVDGIHLPLREYERQLLVDEMVKNGLDPSDYGYERFCNKDGEKDGKKDD